MLADAIHLSYPLAFLAGLVSVLSPCVFPLLPVYAAYLGGRAGAPALKAAPPSGPGALLVRAVHPARAALLANGIAFVAGFSSVFVAVFYVLKTLDVTVLRDHQRIVDVVAGLIVLVLAVQTLGLVRVGVLAGERRLHLTPRRVGLAASLLLGISFAAGWTPCIGPQLAAISAVASSRDLAGLPVMLVYCLGFAIPFLVVALLADRLQGAIRAINRHLGIVNLVAGGLLVVMGLLLITDQFTFFNRFAPASPFDL